MQNAARTQAIIELLTLWQNAQRPADTIASKYFRDRRYIGSKDRQAVAEGFYRVLRHYGRLSWHITRRDVTPTPRMLLVAALLMLEKLSPEIINAQFDNSLYAPEPLTDAEKRIGKSLAGASLEHPDMPENIRLECPDWAESGLRASLGDHFTAAMQAMLEPAPLDLRVNLVKGSREKTREILASEGIEATETTLSPWGLRLGQRAPIANSKAFKDGLIEIQDEGSQLIALLCDARPGMQMVDFCAGAGGKTLAIAATMKNKGRVIACDVLSRRLERAKERFRRAGVHNIETRALTTERDPWVKRHKGQFDRVLIDAPCSGVGTWRRNPDARWQRLGPDMAELTRLQASILDSAARLVRVNGGLIYATCSLLHEENAGQVENFLKTHPDFELVPISKLWPHDWCAPPCDDPYLSLSPALHHTDGFFAAALVRNAPGTDQPETADLPDAPEA